ncbi:tRNA uridine-5-carboxymethylaminomethyl(34) synthesis GTPase MnmE [uncultured Desulfosarcina sp.]|uniref:tRNA uridine-5-carboxymethylaminomethyl(34) synthesis GTPase MnmE n=1 Tax=uncultured Desulfosarcina sp. TaxID=218289 RepID=UPI0029C71555|nr:tRNA uridine-5-carboxymethylaminomethyl(34) synthesis GTPase MnmE [uncultured Desulfosarcina sp.]
MTQNTIAAISTPLGPGGIGIVRISGPNAFAILKKLFVRDKQKIGPIGKLAIERALNSHVVYYGHLIDPENGIILDEVLAIYMKAPKSFTREDVVEFHSHSGFVVLDRILSVVVNNGAVLSGPGEFTKRAFLNGRIDLTQAEAVIDLINAPCETAVQLASCQVAGGLRDVIQGVSDSITTLVASCEAGIEFSEESEIDQESYLRNIQKTMRQTIFPEISLLIQRQKDTAIFKEGLLLAIAGAPNVGKSSLLNRLVERETAIVSEVPGTTRDVVREYFSINGVPVIICDTAGIHDTNDPVERIGIKKARDHFNQADLVILVLEATREVNGFEKKLAEELGRSKTIAVINKDDLAEDDMVLSIQKQIDGVPHIRVSAKTGTGIVDLKRLIFKDLLSDKNITSRERITPNLRQRKILEKVLKELEQCVIAVETVQSLEVVSGMLNDVLRLLDEVSGNRNKEELYDHIFSQFCIGK